MGRLRQAARTFADSTLMAARPLRWAVRVYSTTDRETTGLVEVERIVLGGGDRFWVQVRNSVYLATDDLIWIIKDTAAQGNWTFDGFVEGGGTGESVANSPIPSVATPVLTAPDNSDIIIRPPAGQTATIGRAGEVVDFAGGITIAEGITFSNFGAGIVQTSAAGAMSSDYTIDATLSLDGDLSFVGAQQILTTAGDLNINPVGDIYFISDMKIVAANPTTMYCASGAHRRLRFTNTTPGFNLDCTFDRIVVGADQAAAAYIDLQCTSVNAIIATMAGNAAGDRAVIKMQRAHNTLAAPALVANGDQVFSFLGAGYDGAAYQILAGFTFEVDGVAAAGDMPGRIIFETTPAGAVARVEAMRINNARDVSIGFVGSGLGQLHVDQYSGTGAQPVLYLDQADVDEPFTNYVGTSAAAATNSLSSWTTGNAIQGHVQIDINGVKRWFRFYDDPTS